MQGSELMQLSGDIIAYFKKRMFPICRENVSQMHCKDENQSRIISNLPPFFLNHCEELREKHRLMALKHLVGISGLGC